MSITRAKRIGLTFIVAVVGLSFSACGGDDEIEVPPSDTSNGLAQVDAGLTGVELAEMNALKIIGAYLAIDGCFRDEMDALLANQNNERAAAREEGLPSYLSSEGCEVPDGITASITEEDPLRIEMVIDGFPQTLVYEERMKGPWSWR